MLVANRASTEVIDLFIDLNKGTVSLSSELFPFFCMYIVLPFSPFLLYTSFFNSQLSSLPGVLLSSAILSFSCFSRFTLFSFTPLFWFLSFCDATFSSIFNFPHTRSVDHNCLERGCIYIQPRIKAPFPFQNILSRPWSVKIRPTDHPVGYTWSNHGFVDWVLFYIVGKMGRRNNGSSE